MLSVKKKLKRVSFIVDPTSGFNRKPGQIVRMIEKMWADAGIEYEIFKVAHQGHGVELAELAAASGVEMVVAVGDDNMISEIAQGLLGSKTALGVIPAGAANGFARNLKLPLDQRKAITALQTPEFVAVDIGRIDKHYFLNVAGAGLTADIAFRYNQNRMIGVLPYYWRAMRQFFRSYPQKITLQFEGKYLERRPLMVCLANLPQFGNQAIIAPEASLNDGMLNVCVVNSLPTWKAILNLPRLFNGTIDKLPEVEIFRTKRVIVHREEEGVVHADGKLHYSAATLTAEAIPGKLRVAMAGF
ncbi:MAG: diacylglycerol/lipid kinase family protein [Calditrichia bacterium]